MASNSNANNNQIPINMIEEEPEEVLSPDPIRFVPPPLEIKEEVINNEQQAQQSTTKKRNLTSSEVKEIQSINFELYKCKEGVEMFLVMKEVGTVDQIIYKLTPIPIDAKGIKKMGAKEIDLHHKIILHHNGENFEEIGSSSKLTMSERLTGWTVEKRLRTDGSLKFEKFYSHKSVKKTFRSMTGVSTFIAYNIIY